MAMSIHGDDVETVLLPTIATDGGGTIQVPVGTWTGFFSMNPAGLVAPVKYCRFVGAGWGSVLQYAGPGGNVAVVANSFAPGTNRYALYYSFEQLLIDCNNGLAAFGVDLQGYTNDIVEFDHVWFKNFTGFGVVGDQCRKASFNKCRFTRPGDAMGVGVEFTGGIYDLSMTGCTFEWLSAALIIDSGNAGEVPSERAFFDNGNRIEGGYWLVKTYPNANATGSGGTVTYGALTLTDTTKNFGAIPFPPNGQRTIRAMPVRHAGTTTNVGQTVMVDGAAAFNTYGIKRGDIVRAPAANAFSVVVATDPNDGTKLYIEGWRDMTTYEELVSPNIGVAYTVYGVYIGDLLSILLPTEIGVERWRDLRGNTVLPAAGTLYEILVDPSAGGINLEPGLTRSIIGRAFTQRTWGDGISVRGDLNIVANLVSTEIQDTGATIQGEGTTLHDSVMNYCGAQGVAVAETTRTNVIGVTAAGNGTEYNVAPLSGGIAMFDAVECVIALCMTFAGDSAHNRYAVLQRGNCADNRIVENYFLESQIEMFLAENTVVRTRMFNNDGSGT